MFSSPARPLTKISLRLNSLWLAYTFFYIILFLIIGSERVSGFFTAPSSNIWYLPLNVAMNLLSIALAMVGTIVSSIASRSNAKQWTILSLTVSFLMVVWMIAGSYILWYSFSLSIVQ